ncbi:energy transducer TonB [Chryseobacterium taeanense]|uniref:energy transducer TonB n=1 Tax=Chryseobacterium taeanense TaxID=311334 RepID=UPI0035ADAD55
MKPFFLFLFFFISALCFSQQTEDFRLVKQYYNQHRSMLGSEFKKKFDAETDNFRKLSIKQDYLLFMQKMDSVENVALTAVLLKTKNMEDLARLNLTETTNAFPEAPVVASPVIDKAADYPGGINELRTEVANLFYLGGVYSEIKTVKTSVAFIVERDGSITHVEAQGDNFTFNRQAEIALYSVSQKFSPAIVNGNPVRYRFRLPLTMNIE